MIDCKYRYSFVDTNIIFRGFSSLQSMTFQLYSMIIESALLL